MTTYNPDNEHRNSATRWAFDNDVPANELFMRDDLAIAPPLTEDEIRDLQARFDADHLRPVFDRKRTPAPRWLVPMTLVAALLVYLGVALALEAWLFR